MSVTLAWTVKIGGVASPTDFTSRVLGAQITQRVTPQELKTDIGRVTLDNRDGALTPNAGGTYDSVDWFAQAVFIECQVNGGSSIPVFHGLLDDFVLADDGTDSVVNITAIDALSAMGTTVSTSRLLQRTTVGNAINLQIEDSWGGLVSGPLPFLGQTGSSGDATRVAGDNGNVRIRYTGGGRASSALNSRIMKADVCAAWASTISQDGTDAAYRFEVVGNLLSRDTNANLFTFTGGTPSAGQLPLERVDSGFNINDLVNQVTLTQGSDYVFEENSSSVETYGSRGWNFADINYQYGGSNPPPDSDIMEAAAQSMVKRYSTVRFTPHRLRLTSALLAGTPAGSATQTEYLLSVVYGLWQAAQITWTPTGGSSQTSANVITGRRIAVSPSGTSIDIDLMPAADLQSFVLDSTALGVLDQNRLG